MTTPGSRSRGRILVADDEETFRESTVVLLRREGYDCEGVSTSAEVTEAIRAQQYDLLISDIRMPGNSNLELIESLQKIAPRMPTILVTGYPSIHTAVPAIEMGVTAYLVKPVAPQDLITLADRSVDAGRNPTPPGAAGPSPAPAIPTPGSEPVPAAAPRREPALGEHLRQAAHLTLKELQGSLAQLQSLVDAITGQPNASAPPESHEPALLTAALLDAIRSIERTRHNFKSQELATLRRNLESLMRQAGEDTPPARPSPEVPDRPPGG